jgi:hypothetical protein
MPVIFMDLSNKACERARKLLGMKSKKDEFWIDPGSEGNWELNI